MRTIYVESTGIVHFGAPESPETILLHYIKVDKLLSLLGSNLIIAIIKCEATWTYLDLKSPVSSQEVESLAHDVLDEEYHYQLVAFQHLEKCIVEGTWTLGSSPMQANWFFDGQTILLNTDADTSP